MTTSAVTTDTLLFEKNPLGRRISGRVAEDHVARGILDSSIVEILNDPSEFGAICRGHVSYHLFLDEEALPGISGCSRLDHVVGPTRNSPSLLQVLKFVPGLEG